MRAAVVMFGAHCRSRFAGLEFGSQYPESGRRMMHVRMMGFGLVRMHQVEA